MKLSDATVGMEVRITSLNLPVEIRGRLLGLGFVPGVVVKVIREAPLGDPRVYLVKGKQITLRNSEAEMIEVELISNKIPLILAEIGKLYRVVSLEGGHMFLAKMKNIGIEPGVLIKLVEKKHPFVIEVDGEKVQLGQGMAKKIMVEEA